MYVFVSSQSHTFLCRRTFVYASISCVRCGGPIKQSDNGIQLFGQIHRKPTLHNTSSVSGVMLLWSVYSINLTLTEIRMETRTSSPQIRLQCATSGPLCVWSADAVRFAHALYDYTSDTKWIIHETRYTWRQGKGPPRTNNPSRDWVAGIVCVCVQHIYAIVLSVHAYSMYTERSLVDFWNIFESIMNWFTYSNYLWVSLWCLAQKTWKMFFFIFFNIICF